MNRLICFSLLLAACSSSPAGPKGKDPTVLVINQATDSGFYLTWYDQSGQISTTRTPADSQQCVHFTSSSPADSVRYTWFIGDTVDQYHTWARGETIWFNPATGVVADTAAYPFGAEYWTIRITGASSGSYFQVIAKAVASAPC